MADREQDLANLATVPGIGRLGAEIIVAETGGDMAQFASARYLTLLDRGLPGPGRVRRRQQVRPRPPGQQQPQTLAVFFRRIAARRIAARRGGRRALVAVTHKLALAIWHVLHHKTAYRELGTDHFARRDPERAMRRRVKQANNLGPTTRCEPITTT